jgi:nucleoside-diphosphate-sugar epimerase
MSRQPSTDLGICLVHGAETALGAALLSQLSERGTKLRALGGDDRPPLPDGVEWAGSSPSDNEGWEKACGGVATVFDCAGSAAAASIREPNAPEDSRSNALLAACRAVGVVRIVHVSGV